VFRLFRKKEEYQAVEKPPMTRPFEQMSEEEAEAYFQWHMNNKSQRIHNMCQLIQFDPDYTEESLIVLWTVVMKTYGKVMRKKMSMNAFDSIINCCSLYLGEVLIKNNTGLFWQCYTEPDEKNIRSKNMPVIAGFRALIGDIEKPMILEPMRKVYVAKRDIANSIATETALYDLYQEWQQYSPDKELKRIPSTEEKFNEVMNKVTRGRLA
jgi:hypothetical protein